MVEENQKICFVIMGFGKKTDFETGRTLDLDATYEAIIRPAVTKKGLRCIRADEIIHSGIIDTEMYEMLLRADLVIADISTGNPNAIYELGVRHALRPNSTIILKESGGRLYFDLDHINTFQYEHLGEGIRKREADRAELALSRLIEAALNSTKPDSPVYTFLPRLQSPSLTDEEYTELLNESEEHQERLRDHVKRGEGAVNEGDFESSINAFNAALKIKPGDPYLIQRLTLSTYKNGKPSSLTALIEALKIIDEITPESSNDPETLGLTGAICKRIWNETNDAPQLDKAIQFYGRGYEVRKDYYNGGNLATCYVLRSKIQQDPDEKKYDEMSALKVRSTLFENLSALVEDPSFDERSDKMWIYGTISHCAFALGDTDRGDQFELLFKKENPVDWELKTFEEGKQLTAM